MGRYSTITSATYIGLHGFLVNVEVHIANGLPRFKIVGLPDKTVEEAKERVTAAIKSSGYTFPLKRITVNLTPAHIPKHGTSFDLPIALGIISASGQISVNSEKSKSVLIYGELGLNGTVRKASGIPIIIQTGIESNMPEIVIPEDEAVITPIPKDIRILSTQNLRECAGFISDNKTLKNITIKNDSPPKTLDPETLSDIFGHESTKRTLAISAAGGHHISLTGPPGVGKTLLIQSLNELLPQLSISATLDLQKIYSISEEEIPQKRPFRKPHHSSSYATIFGNGSNRYPGEITLAHHGVLFLDEFPLFSGDIIRGLRIPLDSKRVTIPQRNFKIEYPANMILATAMNPCPCGYLKHPTKKCTCQEYRIQQYQSKIPGPIWDRIDLHQTVFSQDVRKLKHHNDSDTSKLTQLKENIHNTWKMQHRRSTRNNSITLKSSTQICPRTQSAQKLLDHAYQKLSLSTRNYIQTLRIARTIADLDQKEKISEDHVAEALSYRKTALTL